MQFQWGEALVIGYSIDVRLETYVLQIFTKLNDTRFDKRNNEHFWISRVILFFDWLLLSRLVTLSNVYESMMLCEVSAMLYA